MVYIATIYNHDRSIEKHIENYFSSVHYIMASLHLISPLNLCN
jgi:hypothetical protein